MYWNINADHPDFSIVNPNPSSVHTVWGTYNDHPYTEAGSSFYEGCNFISYSTRPYPSVVDESTTSNAYFYIWVR